VSFGQKISDASVSKLLKSMQSALKKDDSPLKYSSIFIVLDFVIIQDFKTKINYSLGYIFHIAANLGSTGNFAFNHIEDAIIQADEVDGQFLQFEGGLSITSNT
jgi:oligosaccharyltransferase complex subunit delta (ribophorin II)